MRFPASEAIGCNCATIASGSGASSSAGASRRKTPQFAIQHRKDERGFRAIGIPFEDQPAARNLAGEKAVGPAWPGKGFQQLRQGFGHGRGNCKSDDRRLKNGDGFTDDRPHGRRVLRHFDQTVRAVGAGVVAPGYAAAARCNCHLDGSANASVEDSVGSQGRGGHVNDLRRALVVSTGKNSAWVSLDGEPGPRIAQLRRMSGKRSMPVPGDIVHVRILEDERVVVDRTEPRTFALERRTAGGRSKTMAANVDSIVTVISLGDPPPRLTTLDQLLAFAELESVAAMVVMTKPDRGEPAERARLSTLYRELGYSVIVVDPKTGENVDGFRSAIAGHRALLTGVSGVGKSTIFRALGGEAIVGGVSRSRLGRQTTTTARLYRMGDGFLIDSPGVNEFGLGDISAGELAPLFREMVEPALRCRFNDCHAFREPDCAVAEAATKASSRSRATRATGRFFSSRRKSHAPALDPACGLCYSKRRCPPLAGRPPLL